ncbi:hypothetical protein [Serinicoccus sp. LYQ131]|uniref:hypothetical protein n=1 Tax=Serinicoccus sp. LYQ131 TaxID=3378797 RepID=UPI00385290D8
MAKRVILGSAGVFILSLSGFLIVTREPDPEPEPVATHNRDGETKFEFMEKARIAFSESPAAEQIELCQIRSSHSDIEVARIFILEGEMDSTSATWMSEYLEARCG